MKLKLRSIKEVEGFTAGKTYDVIACAGEYVKLKDDKNRKVTISESYFEIM